MAWKPSNGGSDALDNRVKVEQASDLSGILDPTKEYLIDGIVDMGSQSIEIPSGGLNLKGFNFMHVDLSKANLKDADLTNAILFDANFEGANLENTEFAGAKLKGARFLNTDSLDMLSNYQRDEIIISIGYSRPWEMDGDGSISSSSGTQQIKKSNEPYVKTAHYQEKKTKKSVIRSNKK